MKIGCCVLLGVYKASYFSKQWNKRHTFRTRQTLSNVFFQDESASSVYRWLSVPQMGSETSAQEKSWGSREVPFLVETKPLGHQLFVSVIDINCLSTFLRTWLLCNILSDCLKWFLKGWPTLNWFCKIYFIWYDHKIVTHRNISLGAFFPLKDFFFLTRVEEAIGRRVWVKSFMPLVA